MYHGCIPTNEDGSFAQVRIGKKVLYGKSLLDGFDKLVRKAYYSGKTTDTDIFWYLWNGANSPLFGKDRITTFERYFTEEKELRKEKKNPYFKLIEDVDYVNKIILEFGLDINSTRIINGHVPVKKGENPIKAGGKLFVIDGGIAKSYHKTTGIAGYTLIFNSTVYKLAKHFPIFDDNKNRIGVRTETEVVERLPQQRLKEETDIGRRYAERIDKLQKLIKLYRSGDINPTTNTLTDETDIMI